MVGAAEPLPPDAIAFMTFLAGHWRGDIDGGVIEEVWLAPKAGVAQGTVRLIQADKVGTIELIIVVAERDRVVMRYKHFDPDYRPWESDEAIALTMVDARQGEVFFINPDIPQRHAAEVGYRMTGPDTLQSWVVAIAGDGTRARYSFDYRRVG